MTDLLGTLRGALGEGATRGVPLGLAVVPGLGLGLAAAGQRWSVPTPDPAGVVRSLESELRPRWTWWDRQTPDALVVAGLRVAACWDVAAVHRLLFGGWRAEPALCWAAAHDLPTGDLPTLGQLDLLSAGGDDGGDLDAPVRPDGQLRPEWTGGGWRRDAGRLAVWASRALECAELQRGRLAGLHVGGDPMLTAWSESAAELLCAELQVDGLPIDLARAQELITASAGPRPRDDTDAARLRGQRDAAVLAHAGSHVDLRNPAHVKALLAEVGVDVPDTRSWRLEPFRTAHPVVGALLDWRKAERIATTYGWSWLEHNVVDGRLRGGWSGCDGAAGRMTAQAGLHNLPAELRPAVAAEPGHVFVRADLGQIEPRVLAVVSGDAELARAGLEDDLYAPVAARLRVERPIAKVAVLAAMYGQTSGTAGAALRGLQSAYPVAMRYLDDAYADGRAGRDVRTHGGRLVRMPALPDLDEDGVRAAQGGRGRYARNALVQGAAAEFFKMWAVTLRAHTMRNAGLGARIVLCLHDELLVHTPREHSAETAELLQTCLDDAARRWQPSGPAVRFVADIGIVARWSESKTGPANELAPRPETTAPPG